MTEPLSFGRFDPGVQYEARRAAYAVIMDGAGAVVAVKGAGDKYWLPGGGAHVGESAQATIIREVREELGRGVRLSAEIGRAIQYFYATAEACHYKMAATFFRAELTDEFAAHSEYKLHWLRLADAHVAFFHQCHVWACEQAARPRACLTSRPARHL